MEYKIICEYGSRKITEIVNNMLELGWVCQGGVCRDSHGWFSQAMIKKH